MPREVLKTKLTTPPVQASSMSRPRLIKRLNEGMDRKLILVCAPAGFGKTTMLVEWAGSRRQGFSWLSLDEGDNDPLRFWTHFISSLRVSRPAIGNAALEMLKPLSQPPIETVLIALINEILKENKTLVMILDDFHAIGNPYIHGDLKFLIDHMPPHLHLVVSTRIKVPFSLGRLRIKNQLFEINADDLRFTPQEISTFARRLIGKGFADENIPALETYSEGWAAGLQIAALAIRKDGGGDIPFVSQGHAHMMEYFMEEIFSCHPESTQTFLLETSILERLSGPLCNAVTGRQDSAKMLEALCTGNMLIVPSDREHREYRYHNVFADTLRTRLKKLDPERVRDLHLKAGRWFEENHLPNEAINHAIAAEDWDYAARLMGKYSTIALVRGESSTALRWIQSFPQNKIGRHPDICVSYAWALYLSNLRNRSGIPFEAIDQLLKDADKSCLEQPFAATSLSPWLRQVLGYANTLRVFLAYERGEPAQTILELCKRGLTGMEGDVPIVRAGVYTILGMTYMNMNEPDAAAKALDEARSIAFVKGICFAVITADCFRGYLAKARGRLKESETICNESLKTIGESLIRPRRLPPEMLGLTQLILASIFIEKNDLAEAERMLGESITTIRLIKDTFASISHNAFLARLKTAQGADSADIFSILNEIGLMEQACPGAQSYSIALRIGCMLRRSGGSLSSIEAAIRLADQYNIELSNRQRFYSNPFPKQWYFTEQLTAVRLSLAEASIHPQDQCRFPLKAALDFLEDFCSRVRSDGWGESEIEALILKALLHRAMGNSQQASITLEQAFSLAQPEGYARIFIDEGEPMADMLRRASAAGPYDGYAGRLLRIIQTEHSSAIRPPALSEDLFNAQIEPLSRQETVILQLIAEGLSNQEIADELCIALTTVKTHNYNIFSKFNVKKRYQAVKKARQMNLL